MDQTLILNKLDSLQRCIGRIEEKTPQNKSILIEDIDLQDIIAVNLVRAVQIAVDIGAHINAQTKEPTPSSMGQVFSQLEKHQIIQQTIASSMRSAVGFRNISVHNYDSIDWEIVWTIITQHTDDFKQFAQAISKYLKL